MTFAIVTSIHHKHYVSVAPEMHCLCWILVIVAKVIVNVGDTTQKIYHGYKWMFPSLSKKSLNTQPEWQPIDLHQTPDCSSLWTSMSAYILYYRKCATYSLHNILHYLCQSDHTVMCILQGS
jgi:hypothetical protein